LAAPSKESSKYSIEAAQNVQSGEWLDGGNFFHAAERTYEENGS
jgi:hypothetical protein